ncbi:hypothetical protein HPG69_011165 [Diceros bicornis minor]|uniref:Uncharacterized protein n=1 Tax=Diceros bicornis minor TaxID=77932 RepID=A0A7J7EGQ1_DICBM|nr:hypothetical protein HPG69_011165 [Diceros bicornis minor]
MGWEWSRVDAAKSLRPPATPLQPRSSNRPWGSGPHSTRWGARPRGHKTQPAGVAAPATPQWVTRPGAAPERAQWKTLLTGQSSRPREHPSLTLPHLTASAPTWEGSKRRWPCHAQPLAALAAFQCACCWHTPGPGGSGEEHHLSLERPKGDRHRLRGWVSGSAALAGGPESEQPHPGSRLRPCPHWVRLPIALPCSCQHSNFPAASFLPQRTSLKTHLHCREARHCPQPLGAPSTSSRQSSTCRLAPPDLQSP